MPGFLIEYNRRTGAVYLKTFPGPDGHRDALHERIALERESTDPNIEIVSLASDSEETVRRTHSRYFMRSLSTA